MLWVFLLSFTFVPKPLSSLALFQFRSIARILYVEIEILTLIHLGWITIPLEPPSIFSIFSIGGIDFRQLNML